MARVLYISYTGILEPLGQSQVLQYVRVLARTNEIVLLTFEKPERLANAEVLARIEQRCAADGIIWRRLTYHHRPGIPATIFDLLAGTAFGFRLVRRHAIEIIHARSYIPGMMALAVKRLTGANFLFDMRGFWADERVDGGIWRKDSRRYRFFKAVERQLLSGADHIVSLTRAGAREIRKLPYLRPRARAITVIPTCTNLDLFAVIKPRRPGPFTLGYVGSTGTWYLFGHIARAVFILFNVRSDARFLVITQSDPESVRRDLRRAGVDLDRVEVAAAAYDEVGGQIARMDAGIFFIKPVFSKRASCPTRMGEFLACGKPCLANAGVGDVEEDLSETRTGIAIGGFSDEELAAGLERLIQIAGEPGTTERCRLAAEQRFSLASGVAAYDAVYQRLADPTGAVGDSVG